jgi:hypothetical protein
MLGSRLRLEVRHWTPSPSRQNIVVAAVTCVVMTFAVLSIGVATGLASVGWHTIGVAEVELPPNSNVITSGPVYSSQMRIYQNQNQVDSSDPVLYLVYRYPSDFHVYGYGLAYWNMGSPVNWTVSGGNKYASCENQSNSWGGRQITCQFYSTV